MTFSQLRERVNLLLYGSRDRVLGILRTVRILVSLTAIAALTCYYGMPLESSTSGAILLFIKCTFGFYIGHYLVRFFYDFHPLEFLKSHAFEGVLMASLLLEGCFDLLTGSSLTGRLINPIGIQGVRDWSTWFIQAYFFVAVLIELRDRRGILPSIKFHPATIFISSFLLIIGAGAGLLMMPEMTTGGHFHWLDALFTSTSATCVTGLMVEDTPGFFTHKGHVVLLMLMKLGGLNIIAFGSFLALAARFGVGVKQHDLIEDFVNKGSVLSSGGMLKRVVVWSVAIEIVGSAAMYLFWPDGLFATNGDRLFNSVFLSVSAFNNAGISLFSQGLASPEVASAWMIHWVVTGMVFLGALGMVAMFDLFGAENLRERMRKPWKQIGLATKIALYFSLILVAFGSISYFFLEFHGTLQGMSTFGKVTTSVFQSVTRTSGFNTVDIGSIGMPMLLIIIVLMFIGSSSSSTGGGIKTSTLAIVGADVTATVRGRRHVQIFKRTISPLLRARAHSVLMFFVVGNLLGIFLLSLSESAMLASGEIGILDLVFEEVSAMGTVGLSTGITADLTPIGRSILIISMLVGRVGTLTVVFSVSSGTKSRNYKYPAGHTMVG
jgi:Trk-type K+ transport system membrane component